MSVNYFLIGQYLIQRWTRVWCLPFSPEV